MGHNHHHYRRRDHQSRHYPRIRALLDWFTISTIKKVRVLIDTLSSIHLQEPDRTIIVRQLCQAGYFFYSGTKVARYASRCCPGSFFPGSFFPGSFFPGSFFPGSFFPGYLKVPLRARDLRTRFTRTRFTRTRFFSAILESFQWIPNTQYIKNVTLANFGPRLYEGCRKK